MSVSTSRAHMGSKNTKLLAYGNNASGYWAHLQHEDGSESNHVYLLDMAHVDGFAKSRDVASNHIFYFNPADQ